MPGLFVGRGRPPRVGGAGPSARFGPGEEVVVGSLGWLTIIGCGLCVAAFWRLASQESRERKQALIDQTLEYERVSREPRD
jgi:hypothetical protein